MAFCLRMQNFGFLSHNAPGNSDRGCFCSKQQRQQWDRVVRLVWHLLRAIDRLWDRAALQLLFNMAKPCLGDTVEVVSNETIYVGVLSAIDVRKGRLSLDKG